LGCAFYIIALKILPVWTRCYSLTLDELKVNEPASNRA
jgi:hypothetical protein